ncbi:hypothetical protein CKM354_001039200 [Cercospora kikuchii]|uniref:Heterokaryon incompatibility domain-containing protein n=1 Tax=Cercospora kikuchii TaxID=84275 RepID=A0A9P3FJP9_9PEZI|nr:uncharacterized protein CKM354_001039200 [Cercospora kikuchii]GIZ47297.1 hypothetical protein CKM354_001039200 [Cercospora kikuchii]
MRLLNVSTLELKEFGESSIPPYYIASHRWTSDETTYKDVKKRRNTTSTGYRKLQSFCDFIQRTNVPTTRAMTTLGIERSCQWLWIDTACMDKTSSADLSECINSMFHYYADAQICYAYLHDVGPLRNHESAIMDFVQGEWFRRGWTLQELLAPRKVVFLNRDWEIFGHKCQLQKCDLSCQGFGTCLNAKIEKITSISLNYLSRQWMPSALRLMETVQVWMQSRQTERIEDQAYCLLGLLGINLAPIYGERENAQLRLREEFDKKRTRRLPAPLHRPLGQTGATPSGYSSYDPITYEYAGLYARLSALEARYPKAGDDVWSVQAESTRMSDIVVSESHITSQRTKSAPNRARYKSHGPNLVSSTSPVGPPELPAGRFSGPTRDVSRTHSVSAKRLRSESSNYSQIAIPDLSPLPPVPVLPTSIPIEGGGSTSPFVSPLGRPKTATGSLTPPGGAIEGSKSLTVALQHAMEAVVARSQSTRTGLRKERLRKTTEAINAQPRINESDSSLLITTEIEEDTRTPAGEKQDEEAADELEDDGVKDSAVGRNSVPRPSLELEAPEELHTHSTEAREEDLDRLREPETVPLPDSDVESEPDATEATKTIRADLDRDLFLKLRLDHIKKAIRSYLHSETEAVAGTTANVQGRYDEPGERDSLAQFEIEMDDFAKELYPTLEFEGDVRSDVVIEEWL